MTAESELKHLISARVSDESVKSQMLSLVDKMAREGDKIVTHLELQADTLRESYERLLRKQ